MAEIKKESDECSEASWLNKAMELAKREILALHYDDWSDVIRFALPDDPTKEAGIYLWYKKVECFQELADKIEDLERFNLDMESFMETMMGKNIGYKRDTSYDAYVKDVDTPEEAIEEVKLMLKKMPEIEKALCDALDNIEQLLQNVIQVLSKDNPTPKNNEPKYILRIRHKTPEWMKKEMEKEKFDKKEEDGIY